MSQIQVRMEVFMADTSEDGGVCLWQIQVRMEVCVCGRYK